MAVNQLDRDHLTLVHMCDNIDNIIAGIIDTGENENERKANVGRMVQHLEHELLDTEKWASKDMTVIQAAATAGRTWWKS
mgnify:FL=1|jgi:hypothetical protein